MNMSQAAVQAAIARARGVHVPISVEKPHKYGVAPKEDRTSAGITFDSKAEMRRFSDLTLMLRAGKISDLERQKQYDLIVNGEFICSYRADFVYTQDGETVVEDVKGVATAEYRIKKKLMHAVHGITIKEVRMT